LQQLEAARVGARRGLSATELADALEVDILQLEPVLQTLVQLDWIGRVNEIDDGVASRYVMLADVDVTPLEPLMRQLLLPPSDSTARLWTHGGLASISLRDVL
jgi:membrane protein